MFSLWNLSNLFRAFTREVLGVRFALDTNHLLGDDTAREPWEVEARRQVRAISTRLLDHLDGLAEADWPPGLNTTHADAPLLVARMAEDAIDAIGTGRWRAHADDVRDLRVLNQQLDRLADAADEPRGERDTEQHTAGGGGEEVVTASATGEDTQKAPLMPKEKRPPSRVIREAILTAIRRHGPMQSVLLADKAGWSEGVVRRAAGWMVKNGELKNARSGDGYEIPPAVDPDVTQTSVM